jgi:release factor glutamine methyltransferase
MKEIVAQVSEELAVTKNEAELIIASLLEKPRFELYMNKRIDEQAKNLLFARLKLLKNGMPLEYITKKTQFMDLCLDIVPGVFIPRFETENFIELIKEFVHLTPKRILDIGTGTGAISIALSRAFPEADVLATEISDTAIACARKNIEKYGLSSRINIVKCDICRGIDGEFDLIVSNPPYIPSSRLHLLPKSVRDFEPLRALDGGHDGTRFIRSLMAQASSLLTSNGIMGIEIDEDSVQILKNYLGQDKYGPGSFKKDQFNKYRYLFIGNLKA